MISHYSTSLPRRIRPSVRLLPLIDSRYDDKPPESKVEQLCRSAAATGTWRLHVVECNLPGLLVDFAYGTECTDARDKVIALQGLHQCTDYKYELDYSMSVAQVILATLGQIQRKSDERFWDGLKHWKLQRLWQVFASMRTGSDFMQERIEICTYRHDCLNDLDMLPNGSFLPDLALHFRSSIAPVSRLSLSEGGTLKYEWQGRFGCDLPPFRYLTRHPRTTQSRRRAMKKAYTKEFMEQEDVFTALNKNSTYPRLFAGVNFEASSKTKPGSLHSTRHEREPQSYLRTLLVSDRDDHQVDGSSALCDAATMAGAVVCITRDPYSESAYGQATLLLIKYVAEHEIEYEWSDGDGWWPRVFSYWVLGFAQCEENLAATLCDGGDFADVRSDARMALVLR